MAPCGMGMETTKSEGMKTKTLRVGVRWRQTDHQGASKRSLRLEVQQSSAMSKDTVLVPMKLSESIAIDIVRDSYWTGPACCREVRSGIA